MAGTGNGGVNPALCLRQPPVQIIERVLSEKQFTLHDHARRAKYACRHRIFGRADQGLFHRRILRGLKNIVHRQWFLTGDMGVMDTDGQISYLGRNDDMMNAGGYRVSPLEVEAALASHPGILEIGVTDVEAKADARIIAAFYSGPAPLDPDALAAYVKERLARYKQPRAVIYLPELPRGPNGKLLRRALRAHFRV